MKGPSPKHLKSFVESSYHLASYLYRPGDGRPQPQIPAQALLWSVLVGQILRESSFHAVEALVRSPARSQLGVARRFGDDALAYFTERLDPAVTRRAMAEVLRQAKRKKAFQGSRRLGLIVDGTGAGRCHVQPCSLCHPVGTAELEVVTYLHHLSMISLVGGGLTLPFDVEPYPAGDTEVAASTRLLRRAVEDLGPRFADYVVADGLYARAPFLHAAGDLGLHAVVRLKGSLPELQAQAEARFGPSPPSRVAQIDGDTVELWDADDFDPWDALRWPTVRVLRYRQHKPDGTVFQADWLTDYPSHEVSSHALYRMAKSRWGIENQGFNVNKTHHAMEHVSHHHANSLLLQWLLLLLALMIERLYRLRYLHRGTHPALSAIELVRRLRLTLGPPRPPDSS
jgi:hypothetical protein